MNIKKNYSIHIGLFLLCLMQISYALEEDQNPICHEKAIQQLQKAAEQIVQDAKNPYEGQINALLSLKPIVEADCLRLSITNKDEAPKDLNSAIAYVDALNQALSYIIDVKALSELQNSDRKKYNYDKLSESDFSYLDNLLHLTASCGGIAGECSCLSVFESNVMVKSHSFTDLPKWLPEDRKVKIKKYLAWCSKVFLSSIDNSSYWADGVSEIVRFTDQEECSFEKGARLIDQNLCIRIKNYDYHWLRESVYDDSYFLDCSENPLQKDCPYLEVISREKSKVKKKKFLPDMESVLSDISSSCGVDLIRVDPKTKQFSLSGTGSGDCFGGYGSFEIEEIYEIRQLKPVIVKINSTGGERTYRNDAELEGLANGKTEK